ncbi:YncE family protein [Martelella soudanensis]|uniref:YncE family protein n=1 Tax=unclassified Martelella TaxID=2629616 RepID=UPI0015DE5CAB|nr:MULTISPECIES: YncE family protein [unclassified Martelella]
MSEANAGMLVIVEKSSHCLSFYDSKTTKRLDSIDLPRYSHEFVVSADQAFAFIGHYGLRTSADHGDGGSSITVVDLAARSIVRTLDCRPWRRIHGIALDGRGRLLALSEGDNILMTFDDPLSVDVPSRAVPSGGLKGHLFRVSADGETAYCCNLLSHTVTKVAPRDAAIPPIAVTPGEKPEGIWLNAGGDTLYVTNRLSDTLVAIDTASMRITREMKTRSDPLRVYGLAGNRLLLLNCGDRSISLVDAEGMRELGCLPLGSIPLAAHVVGETAFISLADDRCAEVELADLSVVKTFATQSEPDCCFLLDAVRGEGR